MSKLGLLSQLRKAHEQSERSYASLLGEMWALRRAPGRVGTSEYFDYRLYENDLSLDEKLAFCGYRGQTVLEATLVDAYSKFLSLDKLTFYSLMQGHGFPIPHLQALYSETGRTWPGRTLIGQQALADFFACEASYPVYLKPSLGSYGRGNTRVDGYRNGLLALGDGSTVDVVQFSGSLDDKSHLGWLIQDALAPHPDIARVCGDRISSVRIHPFLRRQGVTIHRVIWKVNVGRSDSDNFVHGSSGNMLADVDVETGRVKRAVTGVGVAQRLVENHPITGQRLLDFRIPGLREAIDDVRRAAAVFPGFLCQGWDVALCASGPVMLEVNWFGDVDLSQHAMRKGFLDSGFRNLLKERDLERFLKEPAKSSYRSPTGRLGWRASHWPY